MNRPAHFLRFSYFFATTNCYEEPTHVLVRPIAFFVEENIHGRAQFVGRAVAGRAKCVDARVDFLQRRPVLSSYNVREVLIQLESDQ